MLVADDTLLYICNKKGNRHIGAVAFLFENRFYQRV